MKKSDKGIGSYLYDYIKAFAVMEGEQPVVIDWSKLK